jgi:hypothetical protein
MYNSSRPEAGTVRASEKEVRLSQPLHQRPTVNRLRRPGPHREDTACAEVASRIAAS